MTPEKYISEVLNTLGGWCTPSKAQRISEIVRESNCTTYLEIGVFAGRSLFAAALSLPENGIAIGIDPWSKSDSVTGFHDENRDWWGKLDHDSIYEDCRLALNRLGLQSKCFLVRANSQQALPLIQKLGSVSVCYIDGNHSEQAACHDVVNYVPWVRPGGYILMDDLDWTVKHDGKTLKTTERAVEILKGYAKQVGSVENCGIFKRK